VSPPLHAVTRCRVVLGLALLVSCGGKDPAPGPAPAVPDGGGRPPASSGGQAGSAGAPGTGGHDSAGVGTASGGAPAAVDGGQTGGSASAGAGGAGGAAGDAAAPITGDGGAGGAGPAACAICTSWGDPELLGHVSAPGLDALSGMAASWRNPGVIYTHNDREKPIVFALGEDAGLLARITLSGVTASDIEDMEVSRCPAGTCLFAADIGNNISPRAEFSIFRIPEPEIARGAPGPDRTVAAERFAFRYADQPHNAESLIIDPGTGTVYIVTKVAAGQPSAAYRLDTFVTDKVNVATKIADLPVPGAGDQPATAGTAHPCGAGFLLRTNTALFEFRITPGTPFIDAFHATPVRVPAGVEPQSEAVSYQPDGRGYYTTSEGTSPPVHRVRCR
jgi:hypothetical protein